MPPGTSPRIGPRPVPHRDALPDRPRWRLGYRPELDVVRGVAILLVVLGHARIPLFYSGGSTGVTLFFVLSGFLITALLVEERAATGTIDLRAFYVRRALRLLPALAAFLGVMLAIGVAVTTILIGALYVANWARVAGEPLFPIGHLWSLAVEEQFYLVWPMVLMVSLPRLRRLAATAAVTLVLAALTPLPAYLFTTWTHVPSLMLGAGLAIALARGWHPPLPSLWLAGGATLLLVLSALPPPIPMLPTAVGSALLVVGMLGRPAFGPLVAAGRVSYAWYLWHFPVMQLIAVPTIVAWTITIPLSLVLAAVSYRYVEQPFLRLKGRDRTRVPAPRASARRPVSFRR